MVMGMIVACQFVPKIGKNKKGRKAMLSKIFWSVLFAIPLVLTMAFGVVMVMWFRSLYHIGTGDVILFSCILLAVIFAGGSYALNTIALLRR
jgi:hypothetical protein